MTNACFLRQFNTDISVSVGTNGETYTVVEFTWLLDHQNGSGCQDPEKSIKICMDANFVYSQKASLTRICHPIDSLKNRPFRYVAWCEKL